MSKQWKVWLAHACIGTYRFLRSGTSSRPLDRDCEFERIVVFSTTALGDFMFNTPAIRAIRARYPHAKITLVCNPRNNDLVSGWRCVDEVIYWDHRAKSLPWIIWRLRRSRPQVAVTLHSKAPYDVVAAILSGCDHVFKNIYEDEPSGMERWLSGATRTRGEAHLIQSKLDLVAQLGCDTTDREMCVPIRPARSPSPQKTRKTVIGFQFGASQPIRCWPAERFVELARSLLQRSPDYVIALIGTGKEREAENRFLSGLTPQERQRVTSYVGKTTLRELLGVINSMHVLVTGDTGPLHLAIALKVRTVSLFATANPRKTGPYQDEHLHRVVHVPVDTGSLNEGPQCSPMNAIQVDDVLSNVIASIEAATSGTAGLDAVLS